MGRIVIPCLIGAINSHSPAGSGGPVCSMGRIVIPCLIEAINSHSPVGYEGPVCSIKL